MIIELEDRWILRVMRGMRVQSVSRAGELVIGLDSGGQVRVSAESLLTPGPLAAHDIIPQRASEVPESQIELLSGAVILASVVFKDGSLRIVFSTAQHLNDSPDYHDADSFVMVPASFEWRRKSGIATLNILNHDLLVPVDVPEGDSQ